MRSAVEYADECFCSDSYSGAVTAAPASDCNMACTGDSTKTCGAGNRVQIYSNPAAPAAAAALPSGWSQYMACAYDNGSRNFNYAESNLGAQVTGGMTPAKCIQQCIVSSFLLRHHAALVADRQ
jgi:hypothetical protein